jgi:hypothetical protein
VIKVKKRLLLSLLLAVVLVMVFAVPVFSDTSDDITVTASPAFIGISIANDTWTINGLGTSATGLIAPATTYYSNLKDEADDTTAPSATVLEAECYFEIANASTIVTDITANMIHFTGGDAMQNSDGGYTDAGAGEFGASTYIEGATWPDDAVFLKNSGSDAMETDLAATTNLFFGVAIKTQSDAWASGDNMTSTITVTATEAS